MQIVAGANAHAQISISPSHHPAVTEAGLYLSFAKQASQNTTPVRTGWMLPSQQIAAIAGALHGDGCLQAFSRLSAAGF
jgi:hypothetical protein